MYDNVCEYAYSGTCLHVQHGELILICSTALNCIIMSVIMLSPGTCLHNQHGEILLIFLTAIYYVCDYVEPDN